MITDANPQFEQDGTSEFSAPESACPEAAEQDTARESQAKIKADEQDTIPIDELVDEETTDSNVIIAQKALEATVSTPSDEPGERGEEASGEELETDAPALQTGGGGGDIPPPYFIPLRGDEYSEGEPGSGDSIEPNQEAYLDDISPFRELNDGAPHTVARTVVNEKFSKIAQVELGLPTVQRAAVPDDKVDWDTDFPDYNPPFIDLPRGNTSFRKEGDHPDPTDPAEIDEFDSLETDEVRRDQYQRPLNPIGRTGIQGRGMLDKWGPTAAADAILTRNNPENDDLETLVIQRSDTGEWALPGGKVDAGEEAYEAAGRELIEEAGVRGVSLDFSDAVVVYAGYVDDSRNTDNAWMETTAFYLHLTEEEARAMTIEAGSDAIAVRWVRVTDELDDNPLFASQGQYQELALKRAPRDTTSE